MGAGDIVGILIVSLVSPAVLALLLSRSQRATKREQWERDDAVALAAEQAADRQLAQQVETARLLAENNAVAAEAGDVISGQLKVIHTLVNSSMTKAMQSEYDTALLLATTLREMLTLNEAVGNPVDEATTLLLATTEEKIAGLHAELLDRTTQNAIAERQIAESPDVP